MGRGEGEENGKGELEEGCERTKEEGCGWGGKGKERGINWSRDMRK